MLKEKKRILLQTEFSCYRLATGQPIGNTTNVVVQYQKLVAHYLQKKEENLVIVF